MVVGIIVAICIILGHLHEKRVDKLLRILIAQEFKCNVYHYGKQYSYRPVHIVREFCHIR